VTLHWSATVAVALVEAAEEVATLAAWVAEVATSLAAAGMEATLAVVVAVATMRAGAGVVVVGTLATSVVATMLVGVGVVVEGMSATSVVASMPGMMGPGNGMPATMDGMTTITGASPITATSTIASTTALWQSVSGGGPATIATGMAMVAARGCIARRCILEAPIGGTDITPARATPTTDGLHTMRLGIVA
jgi:hypothetical protein